MTRYFLRRMTANYLGSLNQSVNQLLLLSRNNSFKQYRNIKLLGVNNADLKTELDELKSASDKTPSTTSSPPVTSSPPPTSSPATPPPINMSLYRLPNDVIPNKYDIYLHPDLETGLFSGVVTTFATVDGRTQRIVMNSHTLNVTKVFINSEEANFELDIKYERVIIEKKDKSFLEVGPVEVKIEYGGNMKNRIVGLYVSSYKDKDGNDRKIATSKFEPTYARQAFPSFDEPNFKASYIVHLVRPDKPGYIALSNYDVDSEKVIPGGNVEVTFKETVKMSTYLSCFIVADFQATNSSFQNGDKLTDLRVYSTPEQLLKTKYAGEVAEKVIEYYVKYFKMEYPLPKLDLVAIPDFVSGAMEHWGLVTFRETALLYSPTTHSASNKQRVAAVIAHELAHSWFGNLVTMDWWNDLWLNEGFASYIEFKGINAAEPEWKILELFITDTMHSVLSLDATQESHPIIKEVITPDNITEVFDSISYNKGASILRMLEYVVTPSKFEQGVTNYLNKKKYSNAVTQDLLDELKNVTQDSILDIDTFMDTFTRQMGYPILTVELNGNEYVLKQKRFLKDYESAANSTPSLYNYKWDVPVSFIYKNAAGMIGKSEIFWFKHNQSQLIIPAPVGVQWVKFNPDQVGYYRVKNSQSDWSKLLSRTMELPPMDRAHLLEETFSMAESGDVTYQEPLELTKYLTNEEKYVAWSVASSKLQQIAKNLGNSVRHADFQKYVHGLLANVYGKLGWKDNVNGDHQEQLTRVVVLNLACVMEYSDALNQAKLQFDAWIQDPVNGSISQNLRSIVYKYGIVSASKEAWEIVLERYLKENDANEKLKIINGLSNVRLPSLLQRLIDLASLEDESYVRKQDYFTVLQYIAANPVGTPLVWDYVRNNWSKLVARFGINERNLGRLIPGITGSFNTDIKLREMQVFFEDNPEAGAGIAARKQALETIQNNIKWLQKHLNTVEDWISKLP